MSLGEWILLIFAEPPVAGCPLRAFPAEVIGVDETRREVDIKGDPQLLWLHEDPEEPWPVKDTQAALEELLTRTHTLSFGEYCAMHDRRVEDAEVSLEERSSRICDS